MREREKEMSYTTKFISFFSMGGFPVPSPPLTPSSPMSPKTPKNATPEIPSKSSKSGGGADQPHVTVDELQQKKNQLLGVLVVVLVLLFVVCGRFWGYFRGYYCCGGADFPLFVARKTSLNQLREKLSPSKNRLA